MPDCAELFGNIKCETCRQWFPVYSGVVDECDTCEKDCCIPCWEKYHNHH